MTDVLLAIDQSSDEPLYQQVAASVRRAVVDGVLGPDDRLPATRSAATALGVNPETVQRAYRLLADDGVVVSRVGRGTRIRHDVDPAGLGLHDAIDGLVARAREVGVDGDELAAMVAARAAADEGAHAG